MKSFEELSNKVKLLYNRGMDDKKNSIFDESTTPNYFGKAISLCNVLMEIFPNKENEIRFFRGSSFAKSGKKDLAIKDFNFILNENPNDYSANRQLAEIYFCQGKKSLAYGCLACSNAQLFRGENLKLFESKEEYIKYMTDAYENLGIKEIKSGKFIV